MKKSLLYLFMLICSVSLFTACSDDDPETIRDGEIDGVYWGKLDVDAAGVIEVNDITQKVYISKTGENQIKMELRNFSFQTLNLGTIAVEQISVQKNGNSYTFAGSQNITLLVGECAVTVNGTIEGDKLAMNIAVVAGGTLNVKVDFAGTKLSADQSSEAAIQSFVVKIGDANVEGKIDGNNISFIIPDGLENLTFAPTIVISDKATITPASGVEQDFSSPVIYTVTSEDGIVTTKYTVSVSGQIRDFGFDEWETIKSSTSGSTEQYDVPKGLYGTSNPGIMTINEMFGSNLPELFSYTVSPVEGQSGKAAKLQTVYTYMFLNGMDFNVLLGGLVPYVTAGSLFTGIFKTDMNNTLNSTKFGVPFVGEPATFTGYYKYTPGTTYYNNKNEVIADKTDECSIYAVLYEELLDEENNNIPLNGDYNDPDLYIGSSKRIIMKAVLEDGTAKSDWTKFSIPFKLLEGKSYDATKKYYLAIVCSSSAEGDYFMGAPGSTLFIDSFTVTPQ